MDQRIGPSSDGEERIRPIADEAKKVQAIGHSWQQLAGKPPVDLPIISKGVSGQYSWKQTFKQLGFSGLLHLFLSKLGLRKEPAVEQKIENQKVDPSVQEFTKLASSTEHILTQNTFYKLYNHVKKNPQLQEQLISKLEACEQEAYQQLLQTIPDEIKENVRRQKEISEQLKNPKLTKIDRAPLFREKAELESMLKGGVVDAGRKKTEWVRCLRQWVTAKLFLDNVENKEWSPMTALAYGLPNLEKEYGNIDPFDGRIDWLIGRSFKE